MMSQAAVKKLLIEQMHDVETQWSLGTFGAIAEFSRDSDEPVQLTASDGGISAVTARGGIAIRFDDGLRPFASESIARQFWNHRVALCLPEDACEMHRRSVLTELGEDREALREADRGGVLFDLGLAALQADLCVRVNDRDVADRLRAHVGRAVFEPGNPAMGIMLAANPHRVFISRAGRAEVYQPIPPHTGKSPEGPHTHVLPKLLKSGRTHAATEPVPDGWVPCAHFYPAHPTKDAFGVPQPFDARRHAAFQHLLATLGAAESTAIKHDVGIAVEAGQPPWSEARLSGRMARGSVRVALRQMQAAGRTAPALASWLAAFDHAETAGDEASDLARGHTE